MVALIQTTITTVLGPLVAELPASRQTIKRQAEQLVAQAEAIGSLRADLANVHATVATLEAQRARQTVEPPNPLARCGRF
jgi:hypothetical protein